MHLDSHRPPHIYKKGIYFVTARTTDKNNFFDSDNKKDIFVNIFNDLARQCNLKIYAWILLSNHYHIMFDIPDDKINRFINRFHSIVALRLNRYEDKMGRKIWHQYWDHSIRDEEDFYKHFNYIHNNPIKHGLVSSLDRLDKYKYSSFRQWVDRKDKKWILDCFDAHPIIDFTTEDV
ncbi:transposase [Patescibacteria group bacterium]|nr:transposase [Patescibacteria group bacterium]